MINRTLPIVIAGLLAMFSVVGDADAQQSRQAASNVSRPPERHALLIGGMSSPTAGVPAEISAAEDRLVDVLTTAYGFSVDRINGSSATRLNIVSRLRTEASVASPQDSLLVFVLLPTVTVGGSTYLLPTDGNPEQPWTLLRVEELAFSFGPSLIEGTFIVAPYCRSRVFNPMQQGGAELGLSLTPGAVTLLAYCSLEPGGELLVLNGLERLLREFISATTGPVPAVAVAERLSREVREVQFEFRAGLTSLGRRFDFDPIRDRLAAAIDALQKSPSPNSISVVVETTLAATREQRTLDNNRAATALLVAANDIKTSEYVRSRAVQAIGEIKATQSIAGLRALAERAFTPKMVLRAILETIGRLAQGPLVPEVRAADAMAVVHAALRDVDPGVRQAAVRAALQAGDSASTPTIIRLLRSDPSNVVRLAAVQALSVLSPKNSETRTAIVIALRDRDPGVRREAALLLANLGANVSRELIAALRAETQDEVRPAIISALALSPHAPSDGPAIEMAVLPFVDSRDDDVRAAAVAALGGFTSQAAQSRVVAALRDQAQDVRSSAIESAGAQRNQLAVPELLQLLRSDRSLRVGILDALGRIGDRSVVAQVGPYLADDNTSVRNAASRTLSMLSAASELQNALKSTSPIARLEAVKALGEAPSVPTTALIPALGDPDVTVRQEAIGTLSNPRFGGDINLIAEAVNAPNALLQQSALTVIGNLFEASATSNPTASANTGEMLDELLRMQPKDSGVWAEAIRAAGRWGRTASLDPILQASRVGDSNVRRAAAEALGSYRDQISEARLRELASDEVVGVQQAAGESLRSLEAR